jgi:protein tyrosine phosphatase
MSQSNLIQEYQNLQKQTYKDTQNEGRKNENLVYNRYLNCTPWDSTRVKIETLPVSYINASFYHVLLCILY